MIIEEQTASSYIQYTKLQIQIPKYKQITSDFQIQDQPKYLYIHPLVQLHYVGKFSFFYYKNEKYFVGTEEGKVFIRDNNKEKQIEIVQQQEGIVFSLLNKVTPFKSTLKKISLKIIIFNIILIILQQQQGLSLQQYNSFNLRNLYQSNQLSEDDKLLLIGIKQGEIHVYHYSSMTKLDILQFLQPQIFLQFYFQSQEGGLLNSIETSVHTSYELILSDVQGNISKICFDMFKLINQRTIKYEHFILFNIDESDLKDQNLQIYDMKILEKKKMSIKLIIMWNTKIDLLMIKIGKTEEIEIISTIQRINLLSFYHFYNSNNEDKYIVQSCTRNLVSFGSGKMKIFNKEKCQFEEFKQNWILCYYGPQIIIADKNLKPLKFGIISVQKFNNDIKDLEISFISFISENIILIQLQNHQSILVNLDEFGSDYDQFNSIMKTNDQQIQNQELKKYVYQGVQLNQLQNIDFRHRFYIKEDNQHPFNILYIDDCCRASKCILYTWQSYLNVLYDRKEFIQGLQECYQLLNKKNKVLQNIPTENVEKQINEFIKRFAKGFCENIKIFDNEYVEKQIIYVLELLLTTNNEDIIFTDLRDLLKYQNKVSILYKYSEEYQIEQIPFKVLLELEQELQPKIFLKLLKGLDPRKIETQLILPYLLEKQQYELLIHFAINAQDFITPIKILLNQQVVVNFILMVLQGQNVVHEKLLVQNHRIGITHIINYLFNNYFILLKLLDQDQELKIGLMCFHHKVIKIISQLNHEIQISIPQNLQSTTQLIKVENNFEKIYALLTQSYELKLEKSFPKENIKYLYFFQSETILTRMISIKKEYHLKLIKYFILNYDEYKIQNKNHFFLNHFHIFFQNYIHLDDVFQLKNLLNNDLKENTIAECFLLDLIGGYFECLDKWLHLKNKLLRQQIFSWIQSVLQKKLEIFLQQDQIIQYFKYLMEINPKEAYDLVNQYYKDIQSQLINSISDENLALSYIKYMDCILADHILLNEQTKLRFVKYLCQYQKKEVKKYIQQDYFPLKESLSICLESHNYSACEIIYFKLGDIKQVVELMSQKLVLRIKQCTRIILKTKQLSDQEKNKVQKKLEKIRVFIKNNGGEYKEMNNLWLLALDRFFKENPIKNLTAKSLPPLLKGQLQQVAFYILYQMLLSMNFFDFVQIITIKYPEMSSSIFSRILFAIKDLVYQQSQFYYYGQVLHYEEKAKFLQKIKSFVEKGIKVNKLDCGCVAGDTLGVIYKCGHSFHLSCLPNNISRCCLCQNQLKDQVMKIPNQRIVINQRQQFEYKTKEHFRKMDKLRKFENHKLLDQMQKFSCWDIK